MPITIRNLSIRYPEGTTALRDVNLDIENGMFGLLGPNGAGKTSLIRILATLLKPTAGEVRIDDWDLQKNRKQIRHLIGYLPQEFSSFPRLTVWEFVDYIARLKGIGSKGERSALIDGVLTEVGLFEARDRKTDKLSGGMKRRLGIAQTLIGGPKIMIIDEPTVGLDPEERVRFRNLLSDLTRQEKTILLSTHIVGDISSTCARIALLDKGRIVFDGQPADLVSQAEGKVWKVSAAADELEAIKTRYPVVSSVPNEDGYDLRLIAETVADRPAVRVEPSLEDAYVLFMESAEKRTSA